MDDYNKQPGQPGYSQSETPGMATAARMKLSDTAADVKEKVTDLGRRERYGQRFNGVVKRYPGQSLAAAAVWGFLVARGLRSND